MILTIMLILAAIEAGLRIAGSSPRVDNPFFMLVRVFEYPEYFEKDEVLFWRMRKNVDPDEQFLVPGSYRTNSMRLRGAEIEPALLAGKQQIACFGNSCTFGWGLAEDAAYPALLERGLNERSSGDEFRVFNCGVPGYSSYQGLKMLEIYLPKLKPEIAVLCYGWNDHWAAGFDIEDKNQQMPNQTLLDIQNLLSRSYLYRTIKYLLLSRYEKQREYTFDRTSPKYRVSLTDYRSNLIEMIHDCRAAKATPILMTAPMGDSDPGKDQPYEIYHKLYNQMVREVASEYRVPVLDAAEGFRDNPEFFDDPTGDYIHYNQRGAAWIAQQLAMMISSKRMTEGS